MKEIEVKLLRESGFEDLPLPEYQTSGSSGVDLYAAIDGSVRLNPGEFRLISTGIRSQIPQGFEAQVRPRSGLARNHGIGVLNSPGTIDSDYRGIIGVILFNFSDQPFDIKRGDRIAQMVFCKIEKAEIKIFKTLEMSERNSGGFGSTGK